MRVVFEIPIAKKAELMALLEADPYGEQSVAPYQKMSFARNGYKVKDGSQLDEDREKLYLVLRGADEFLPFAKMKLETFGVLCKPEVNDRVMKKIEDEESGAEQGMGAIFG